MTTATEIAPSAAQLTYYRALVSKDQAAIRQAEDGMLLWARTQLRRIPEYAHNQERLDRALSPDCPARLREQVVTMIARIRINEAADPTGGGERA